MMFETILIMVHSVMQVYVFWCLASVPLTNWSIPAIRNTANSPLQLSLIQGF